MRDKQSKKKKKRFAKPYESLSFGLVNPNLRIRTLRIRIADLIRRPFFKRFVLWIQFIRLKISNYLIRFDSEGFVYKSRILKKTK